MSESDWKSDDFTDPIHSNPHFSPIKWFKIVQTHHHWVQWTQFFFKMHCCCLSAYMPICFAKLHVMAKLWSNPFKIPQIQDRSILQSMWKNFERNSGLWEITHIKSCVTFEGIKKFPKKFVCMFLKSVSVSVPNFKGIRCLGGKLERLSFDRKKWPILIPYS